jgi:hypothetical protein
MTGKPLSSKYFTAQVLPNFTRARPDMCGGWKKLGFDPRGKLTEPHTDKVVPLGTFDVRAYVGEIKRHQVSPASYAVDGKLYPTLGPKNRFGDILFIEKEGFDPLLRDVQFAERHDLAIMSTKGFSVTASRELIDELCQAVIAELDALAADRSVRLFVTHDFDYAGFCIAGTLMRETKRYKFKNPVTIIDLGMRMKDIAGLQDEAANYKGSKAAARKLLAGYGATEQEIAFLVDKRVELNAFRPRAFIDWLEGKLRAHGVRKVIPDQSTLVDAYRRAFERAKVQQAVDQIVTEVRNNPAGVDVPADLAARIATAFEEDPTQSWDGVVNDIVGEVA